MLAYKYRMVLPDANALKPGQAPPKQPPPKQAQRLGKVKETREGGMRRCSRGEEGEIEGRLQRHSEGCGMVACPRWDAAWSPYP